MSCSRRLRRLGNLAVRKSSSYVSLLLQYTARNPLSWTRSTWLESDARQKCHTLWQYVSNMAICQYLQSQSKSPAITLRSLPSHSWAGRRSDSCLIQDEVIQGKLDFDLLASHSEANSTLLSNQSDNRAPKRVQSSFRNLQLALAWSLKWISNQE